MELALAEFFATVEDSSLTGRIKDPKQIATTAPVLINCGAIDGRLLSRQGLFQTQSD